MSTAKEIEDAICILERTERNKLLQHVPQLFPEIAGDVDGNASFATTSRAQHSANCWMGAKPICQRTPGSYPKVAESDFD